MGLFDILGGIMDKLEEHSPEIMAAMEKAQKRAEQAEARTQAFKAEYSGLSGQKIQDIASQGVTREQKAAIQSIAEERNAVVEKYKQLYPTMSSAELISEYMTITRKKRDGEMEEPIANLRLSIISKVLKSRDWHLNSDLSWVKD